MRRSKLLPFVESTSDDDEFLYDENPTVQEEPNIDYFRVTSKIDQKNIF